MKEIRALVADDELPARGELTYELSASFSSISRCLS